MNVLESLFQMINKQTHGHLRNGVHAKTVDNDTSKTAYIDQNGPKHSNKINLKSTFPEFVGTFASND